MVMLQLWVQIDWNANISCVKLLNWQNWYTCIFLAHEDHQYKCNDCHVNFQLKRDIRSHLIQRKRRFTCDQCRCHYSRMDTLRDHKMTHHTTEMKFICHACGIPLRSRSACAAHFRIVHARKVKATCPVCEKTFLTRTRFKLHMSIHSGERPYHCDKCK